MSLCECSLANGHSLLMSTVFLGVSHQSLRHKVPVCSIEQLLLHMIIQAWSWWVRRMLIVEDQLGRFVVPRLQEAHNLSIVGRFIAMWLFIVYSGNQASRYHLRFE